MELTPTVYPVWCTVLIAEQEWALSAPILGTEKSTTIQIPLFNVAITVTKVAAILQAIQAVSKYVLENEDEFISQLKAVWNDNKSKHTDLGQQELDQAAKRMAELDTLIQNLYESSVKGTLPERQAQRMIQQYDEEQILLERRVEELKIYRSCKEIQGLHRTDRHHALCLY